MATPMTTPMIGRIARLRASCDTCNEAKVRCSQTKPSCARCARQGVTCVYGLSRRSHKHAPRIGASQRGSEASLGAGPSPAVSPQSPSAPVQLPHLSSSSLSPPTNDLSNPRTTTLTASSSLSSPPPSACYVFESGPGGHLPARYAIEPQLVQNLNLAEGGPFELQTYNPVTVKADPDADDADADADADSPMDLDTATAFNLMKDLFLTTAYVSPSTHWPPLPKNHDNPACESAGNTDNQRSGPCNPYYGDLGPGLYASAQPDTASSCSCASKVSSQLESLSLMRWEGKGASSDAQLCQLRCAVKMAGACITCNCVLADEMGIFLFSTLIGRALQGFESHLRQAQPMIICPNTQPFQAEKQELDMITSTSRLSWGAFEIDRDEEQELTEHLWLLQFRRLARVVKQFASALDRLQSSTVSGHSDSSTHLVAGRCMLMWLERKAQSIGSRYDRFHHGSDAGNAKQMQRLCGC